MELPNWVDWLDRRCGTWAIPHLIRILVVFNIASYALDALSPGFASSLILVPEKVWAGGEWWRLLTFLVASEFTPNPLAILFFVFGLMFLWNIGEGLESGWGPFPLNLYFLIPWLLLVVLALGPWSQGGTNTSIAMALFLAFATLYPDYEITLFPIPIPIKIKWVALVVSGVALLNFVNAPDFRRELLAGMASYFLFFSSHWYGQVKEWWETKERRRRFQAGDEDGN
jgi:hypothetical protein